MKYDDAVRVIENCAGFTEMDCSAGEAWAAIQERIAKLEKVVDVARGMETLLHNLTWENKDTLQKCLHGRWYIHHEPLRNDAAHHKVKLDKALASIGGQP